MPLSAVTVFVVDGIECSTFKCARSLINFKIFLTNKQTANTAVKRYNKILAEHVYIMTVITHNSSKCRIKYRYMIKCDITNNIKPMNDTMNNLIVGNDNLYTDPLNV